MTARLRAPRGESTTPVMADGIDYGIYAGGRRGYIERQTGKPIKAVLLERFEQYGDIVPVARSLDAHPDTVRNWIKDCGLVWKLVDVETERVNER